MKIPVSRCPAVQQELGYSALTHSWAPAGGCPGVGNEGAEGRKFSAGPRGRTLVVVWGQSA